MAPLTPAPLRVTMAGVDDIDFAKQGGLVPCVTQDARNGRVLMVAWMDEQALQRTLDTGEMHYRSRSRDELWHKGETSGNTQQLVGLAADCDADTLLATVHPDGPACHTGRTSCFFDAIDGRPTPVLSELWNVIDDRADELPEDSWTTRLLTEDELAEEKVEEEAREVLDAARGEGEDDLAHELADLVYHALVLARKHNVSLDDVLGELEERRG